MKVVCVFFLVFVFIVVVVVTHIHIYIHTHTLSFSIIYHVMLLFQREKKRESERDLVLNQLVVVYYVCHI
jgi:hypothetical protein